MKRISTLIAMFLAAAALTLPWVPQARAQNLVSFVSGTGSDGDTCLSPSSACATLAGALSKTSDNGTVQCVGAGYFPSATITKSVTLDCLVGGGGFNTQFVIINAPGKKVNLRNLAVNLSGQTATLIDIVAASQVYLENVFVAQNAGGLPGIIDRRAGPALLVIKNSSITNVSGPGIVIAPVSGNIGVELENVTSAYNKYGIAVGNGGRIMIKNSYFTNNSVAGIEGDGGSVINVSGSQVAFNQVGIQSPGNVTLGLSQIVSNTTAITGATQSYGNNQITANSSPGTAPTIISNQ